jgi:hypothetical protein
MGTGATVGAGKLDLDDLVIPIINTRGSAYTGMACQTGRALSVPVNHKLTDIKATLDMGLPADILARWPPECDTIVAPARRQELRIEIAYIDDVTARPQLFRLEGGVELGGDFAVVDRRRRRFHMGNQRGRCIIARFG